MNEDGFRSALFQYIHNGSFQRLDILPQLIQRLQALHETISSLARYRFYSGSLLIVYDGSIQSNQIDVRMIDFAHTTCSVDVTDESVADETGPDRGYLHGIECLIDVFEKILQHGHQHHHFNSENENSLDDHSSSIDDNSNSEASSDQY